MKDADDPIPVPTPEDTIFLSDAFVVVYRALTPDWQLLEERLNGAGQNQHMKDYAYREAERAQRRANEWLREKMSQGALRALVRDPGDPHSSPPRPPQTFQLSRRGWSSMSSFETGFDDDHVGPGDIPQLGPNTVVAGARRPVFFDRKEFNNAVREITQPDGDRAAHAGESAPTAPKTRSKLQTRSRTRYQRIREIDSQLRLEGFEGLQKERYEAIRRKFKRRPPHPRTIQRALKSD